MNILFISIAWPREGERNLYTDLMDEFVEKGHEVYVIGTTDADDHSPVRISEEHGKKVLRVPSGQIRKASHIRKFRSLLTLDNKILKQVKEHFNNLKIELIIAPTPPVTLSRLFKKLKRIYNANFYLLLKDIWPQGSVDLKVFIKYSIPWLYMRSHEVRTYKTADYIGCMSPMGAKYILSKNRFLSPDKVESCPNSIRPIENVPDYPSDEIRKKYKIPNESCVFIFSGNLGMGHGLFFLVEAIKRLADYPDAFFILGGSGTQFSYLESKFTEFSFKNALLYNFLPREDFNRIMATSDVGLILLYRYTVPQFPSRLLSYLEYSKATLCAVGSYTDIGTIVVESGSGLSVDHGDLEGFIANVKYLCEHKEERVNMGKNGRKLLMENFTVTHSYNIIMKHFE